MRTLEEDKQRALDVVRETSYHLWQSLLVINGLFITLVIGILSFSSIEEIWLRYFLFFIITALTCSSVLLVLNFRIMKNGYTLISNLNEEDLERELENVTKALDAHRQMKETENMALYLSAIVLLLLLIFMFIFWVL